MTISETLKKRLKILGAILAIFVIFSSDIQFGTFGTIRYLQDGVQMRNLV